MRTFTLPFHPNTHAHNPFRLQTCECLPQTANVGDVRRNGESSNSKLVIIVRRVTLIQPFRSSLKK
jgi:hypothetical protein